MRRKAKVEQYDAPAGGWGSLHAVASILTQEEVALLGSEILLKQNKPDGFMCVSCSWAKPAKPRPFEFCENGAKATAWEITRKTVGPEFFASHTLSELRTWSDHQLEEQGRLTHPMRYDPGSDSYVPVAWEQVFRDVGVELKRLDPRSVVMYTSGRASLEASYMYQLFGRMYGTNNFPDSSNMCHESTSVALPEVIGVPVGTVLLPDYEKADCILFFGQNTTTNSPRMLHPLEEAAKRGVPIITFNPLRERGLERFTNPQNPVEMLVTGGTRISTQYHQLRIGGDGAALLGLCKAVIEADDAALATKSPRVLDVTFIEQHTSGFDEFADYCRQASWSEIERACGLRRSEILEAAKVYAKAHAVIANYGMGITQHRHGVETVKMIVNLLLLRGNIGKPGAGISPVRGHSNVQGQRTVGISEKTKLVPLDKLAELYRFAPPRWDGFSTVDACEAILKGDVKGFVSLGGNFLRAVPERSLMEPAWSKLRLSVQIATKLNRTHLVPGEITYLLPCLGRIEVDVQASGPQAVSMEDSTTCIHGSRGQRKPVAPGLLSEPAIVAGIAKATLDPPHLDWDAWVGDYSLVRDAIERTYPEQFKDFNARLFQPGGFPRPLGARERKWKTPTGKATFTVPKAALNPPEEGGGIYQLMTLRADGQFNTTIYNQDDRFRGITGSRDVVFMNAEDMAELGLAPDDLVTLRTETTDGVERTLSGLQVVAFNIPRNSIAAYYPECNVLIPLWHYAEGSKVPAAKSVPVRITRDAAPTVLADSALQ